MNLLSVQSVCSVLKFDFITAKGVNMKKVNKLISFVCSFAMATSAFSGILVANAEETDEISQGVVLNYNESASSSTTAVVDISAVGFDSLKSYTISLISETEGAKIVDVDYETKTPGFNLTTNVTEDGIVMLVASINTAAEPTVSDDTPLGTATLTFDKELETDAVIGLNVGSILSGTAAGAPAKLEYYNEAGDTLQKVDVTVKADPAPVTTEPAETTDPGETTEPTETPEPVSTPYPVVRPSERPTPTPEATEAPIETAEPVEQGFMLSYDEESSTSSTAVVDIYAINFDSLKSYTVSLVATTPNVKITDVQYEPGVQGFNLTTNVTEDGIVMLVASINTAAEPSVAGNSLLGTATLTFENTLTENAKIELNAGSIISGTANGASTKLEYYNEETDTLIPTFVVALANPNPPATEEPEPTPEPTPFVGGEIALGDLVVNAPEEDETYGVFTFLDVKVTTADNEEAEYLTDFVAVYDGEELTEDEYINLIAGYTGATLSDIVGKLTFVVKDGVSVYAAPVYEDAEGNTVALPEYGGETVYEEPTETDEPADGMSRLTVSEPTHGSIRINYEDADGNSVTDNTNDGRIVVDIPDGTEVEFIAIADSGYTFSGWSGDLSGTANPATLTMTRDRSVMASFTLAGSNNGGGGSTSSGGSSMNAGSATGGIARPNGGTAASVGTTINFQDLGSVPWAETAINFLAQAGIINGRSSTVFDPNASVTRAEFAKMVCATFGIQPNTTAAQTFTDVSPSDWFYGYVQAASAAGIVNGVSDTAFDPNATIKRQEMAAMLYRAIDATGRLATLPAGTAKTFSDYDQIDDYAKGYVTTLSSAGIINGTSETTFEPYATATRAQAAAILYQYLDAVGLTS